MYFYLIIAFQGFCIYHLFKNRNSFYWIFAILFLPVIGCLTYLVTHALVKRSPDKVPERLNPIVEPAPKATQKIKDLKDKLEFADTYLNRVNLADGYLEINKYPKAIEHYEIALQDTTQNDYFVKENLIKSYYAINDFDKVIAHSDGLQDHREYEKSDVPFLYGMALAEKGRTNEAMAQLQLIDKPYSNYNERLAFAKYLLQLDNATEAKTLVDELYEEMQNMVSANKRIFRATIQDVEKLKKSF